MSKKKWRVTDPEWQSLFKVMGNAEFIFFDVTATSGLKERNAVDPRLFRCLAETGGAHQYKDGICQFCRKDRDNG